MAGRNDFDIVKVLGDAVAPAVAAVFRPGEVESVLLTWEEPITLQDGGQSKPTQLNVHLVCHGEEHISHVWEVGNQEYDSDVIKDHLINGFSDFVAESDWGWGQQR
jgi:hypothetical protein